MIDTYYLESALDNLYQALPEGLRDLFQKVESELYDLECEEAHVDNDLVDTKDALAIIRNKLHNIRLGVYDEERHGDLRATLEELEGLL